MVKKAVSSKPPKLRTAEKLIKERKDHIDLISDLFLDRNVRIMMILYEYFLIPHCKFRSLSIRKHMSVLYNGMVASVSDNIYESFQLLISMYFRFLEAKILNF